MGRFADMHTETIISARKSAYKTITSDIDKYVRTVEALERTCEHEVPETYTTVGLEK